MRKGTFISVFLLLALLLSAGRGVVVAKEMPPVETLPSSDQELAPGLDGPVSEWTDVDLEQLVEMAINEQITVPEIRIIVEQMTEEQLAKVAELLAIRTGVLDEWRQSSDESRGSSKGDTSCQLTSYTGYAWGCYPVEYHHRVPHYKNADWYYSSKECGSTDEDWILYYYIYYASNPDGLRWDTDSTQVYLAFLIYGLDLNSFAYRFDEVQLVVGKTAASMAGGIDKVRDHLYLWGGY
jgi:hypothetical protein